MRRILFGTIVQNSGSKTMQGARDESSRRELATKATHNCSLLVRFNCRTNALLNLRRKRLVLRHLHRSERQDVHMLVNWILSHSHHEILASISNGLCRCFDVLVTELQELDTFKSQLDRNM